MLVHVEGPNNFKRKFHLGLTIVTLDWLLAGHDILNQNYQSFDSLYKAGILKIDLDGSSSIDFRDLNWKEV